MSNILVIESSAHKTASVSRSLVAEFVQKLRDKDSSHHFTFRDLVAEPIDVLNDKTVKALRTRPDQLTDELRQAVPLSDKLIAELKAADFIVIGAGMYNWSIPAALKAWLDQVMRVGFTFGYGENGIEGLINKPALVVLSRGGDYSSAEKSALDMQKPYLANVLKIMGMDVTFAVMEGALLPDEAQREANLNKAKGVIDQVVADF